MPLRSLRPEIPVDLEATVARCLKKEADSRVGSILELAQSLEDFVTKESRGSVLRIARLLGVALPPTPIVARAAAGSTTDEGKSATVPSWENGTRPSQKMRQRAFVSAALATVAVIVLFAWRRSSVPEPAGGPRAPSIGDLAPRVAHPAGTDDGVPAAAPRAAGAAPSASVVPGAPSSESPSGSAVASKTSSPAAPSAAPPEKKDKPKTGLQTHPALRKRRAEDPDDGTADRK
jgi:hypothetical protein